jgi:hypothetical protein
MKKAWLLLAALALPCAAQTNIQGTNIQIGGSPGSTGGGGFPANYNLSRGTNAANGPGADAAWTPSICTGQGVVFTQYGCANLTFSDDGTTAGSTPRNLTGLFYNYNAWGPGGKGNAEGRTTQILGDSGVLATPGIKNVWASSTAAYGIGDALFMNWNHTCNTGTAYSSDQGCQLIYNYGGEQRILSAGANGYFHATVAAGGTQTAPNWSSVGGCTSPLNQSCVPSPGAWMIDTQTSVSSGTFTGAVVAGPQTYLASGPTSATLPVPAAYAHFTGSFDPATTWDAPKPITFSTTSYTNSLVAGTGCLIGNGWTEQNTITAASISGGTETVTMLLSRPENNFYVLQGPCHYLSLDADYNVLSVRYTFPAFSLDGSNLLFTVPNYGQNLGGANILPYSGGMWERFDGGPNSGFHLYNGARVLMATNTTGGVLLEPNTAFSVGDTVESPEYPSQKVNGFVNTTLQNIAGTTSAHMSNAIFSIDGPGSAGSADVFEINNEFSVGNNCASYNAGTCGGNLTPPFMSQVTGVFGTYWNHQYTPATGFVSFLNHLPGQTSYSLFSDPSWGNIGVTSNDTNTGDPGFTIAGGAGLDVFGTVYSGGSMNAAVGYAGGTGNGAGNLAGISFAFKASGLTPTYLTPCSEYPFGGGGGTDLCVSSQGNSRSSYALTADRAIQADHFTATGASCAGCAGSLDLFEGTPKTPAAGHAIFEADASGNGMLSNNGAAPALICVAGGGVSGCGGALPTSKGVPTFNGSGVWGPSIPEVPAEAFGAVGNASCGAATDSTTALQNAINSLASTGGVVRLQPLCYKISSALSITNANVGIVGFNSQYGSEGASIIYQTSATADTIDVTGTSSVPLWSNRFENLTLQRAVVPTGTASGLSLNYANATIVRNVTSVDSIRDFYIHGSGSLASGFENSNAAWGYVGPSETSGNYYGFYIDSTDGTVSPSMFFQNNFISSNLGATSSVTYAVYITGSVIKDQDFDNTNIAGTDYGVYINYTGGATGFAASDLHFWHTTIDSFKNTGVIINALPATANGSVEFNGGWISTPNSTLHGIACVNSSGVTVSNMQFSGVSLSEGFYSTGCSNVAIANNIFMTAANNALTCSGGSTHSITGNVFHGNGTGTQIFINLPNCPNSAITGNTIDGGGSTGISLSSSANTNVAGNSVASTITTAYSGTTPVSASVPTATGTISTYSTSAGTQATIGDYGLVFPSGAYRSLSFNGSHTDGTRLGFVAGGTSDNNLYVDVPTGGAFDFRINNQQTAVVQPDGSFLLNAPGASAGSILHISPTSGGSTLYGSGLCYGGAAYCPTMFTTASGGSVITTSAHTNLNTAGDSIFASGTLTVTFPAGGTYASANTYSCTANDVTAANPIQVVYNSGSSVTFNGTGTDHFRWICAGE